MTNRALRVWCTIKRIFWRKAEASHYWFTPPTEGSL